VAKVFLRKTYEGCTISEINTNRLFSIFLFTVSTVSSGAYSIMLGTDMNWDLMNYHFYVPYALVQFRYTYDIAPAQLQTYFNPTIDIPTFLLIDQLNSEPRLIAFIIGAAHGVNIYVLTRLAWALFNAELTWKRSLLTILAVAIGITGAAFAPLIGTTTGDLFISALVLSGLYFVAIQIFGQNPNNRSTGLFIGAGLVGLAVGLKPVAAVYACGLLAAVAISTAVNYREKIAIPLGLAIGCLISGGWYLVTMELLFQNPVFPFFNGFFRSPYWEPYSFRDLRFLPTTFHDWIFYPLRWALAHKPVVSELPFRDPRAAIVLTLITTAILAWILTYMRRYERRYADSAVIVRLPFLSTFWIVSYILWLAVFSIYRYFVPLELLSGVLIVGLIMKFFHSAEKAILLSAIVFAPVFLLTERLDFGHGPFARRYIDVNAPALEPDSLVIIVGDEPVSFVIPFLNPKARFIGIRNNMLQPTQKNLLVDRAKDLINSHRGPLFTLEGSEVSNDERTFTYKQLALSRMRDDCLPIKTNLEPRPLLLCPIERKP
jgi:hypothetical protein